MSVILEKKYGKPFTSIEDEIRLRLADRRPDSFVYVVPTRRKVRELQRDLLNAAPGGVSSAFQLFTLETLAIRLSELILPPRQLVAGPSQAVLMHKAFESVLEELQYFSPRPGARTLHKGTFQRVVNVINSMKQAGVYPNVLHQELAEAEEGERTKLRDILRVYSAYEELLDERFTDAPGIFKDLNFSSPGEIYGREFRRGFPRVDAVFVAGFDQFSDPEITMLHNLVNLDGIGMVISFDYHPHNDSLFGHLKENYEKFLEIGFRRIAPPARPSVPAVDDALQFQTHIAEHMFRRDGVQPRDVTGKATFFAAADREQEVVCIAKIIKTLVAKSATRDLSKICIAVFQPHLYTGLFREVFSRYGIPANITDRYALDQSSFVVAIVSLLQVWSNNFRQRDVMRALTSPYFDFSALGEPVDAGNLHQISAQLRITVGRSAWLRRIDRRRTEIAEELKEAQDDFEEGLLLREDQQLLKALRDIEALASVLRRFDGAMTPAELRSRILTLLDELRVPVQLMKLRGLVQEEQLEKDTRAYQKFLNFLEDFVSVLDFERSSRTDSFNVPPARSLASYLNELRVAIPQVRYNVRQKYGYGVYVTALEETRGLQFDVMFIPGLVDGEFPPVYEPEVFLSNSRQRKKERYHLTEHRYLFYQGLTNFTEHLYLSYPRKDGELELVPSSFLDSLLQVIRWEDWKEAVPLELTEAVFSEDELLERTGKILGEQVALREATSAPFDLPGHEVVQLIGEIVRSIQVNFSRAASHDMPEFEGLISEALDDQARAALESYRGKIFSVSQLEQYGQCPFRYFASRVLRLNVLPEVEEALTPLERGAMLHDILFEFYVDRRERRLPMLSECSDRQYEEAITDVLGIAEKKLSTLGVVDPIWGIEKEILLGGVGRKGVLREFLENERERKLEVKPAYFEVAFGRHVGASRNADPELRWTDPVAAGNVRLRGKVDRIEVSDHAFTIVDYKTGQDVDSLADMLAGLSLQIPVYLYAVEKILSAVKGRPLKPAAGIYYKLIGVEEKVGVASAEHQHTAFRGRKTKAVLANDEELRHTIDQAIEYVNRYVESIARGVFPLATPDKAPQVCRYCDFQRVCRIQTQLPVGESSESISAEDSSDQ
jgi:ATP-dependent helicase/nuclease subunit B